MAFITKDVVGLLDDGCSYVNSSDDDLGIKLDETGAIWPVTYNMPAVLFIFNSPDSTLPLSLSPPHLSLSLSHHSLQ